MNNITAAQFQTLFPEFTKITTAALELWIPIASNRVDPNTWGTNTLYATALLLAHMLTASGKSGLGSGGGSVTNESVGDLSRGFGTLGADSGDEGLMTTRYGQDYVALRRETFASAIATGPKTMLPPVCGGFPYGY